jgi:hypothetical protein
MDRAIGLEWPPLELRAHISAYLVSDAEEARTRVERFVASQPAIRASREDWRAKDTRVYLLEIYDGRHVALLSSDDHQLMPSWHDAFATDAQPVSRFDAGALLPGAAKVAPMATRLRAT